MDGPAGKHLPYHQLLEALGQPGCALCGLGAAAARSRMESAAGESLTDPAARERWRDSFGFCPAHAAQFEATAPCLTVAILYEDLVRRFQEELAGRPRRRRPAPCPACAAAAESEEGSLRILVPALREPEMRGAYAASPGLCRRHLLALLPRLSRALRSEIAREEAERLQRLEAELAEVRRKHDHRYAAEPWGEERTAPERAVRKVTG